MNQKTVEKIEMYIDGLMDDGGIYHIDNEAEGLLCDALTIIKEKEIESLNRIMVKRLLSKVRFLEDKLKSLQRDLTVAITKGASDSVVNEILTDYRKHEMAYNKILAQEVTLHD